MACEDFPCCGHENSCCPNYDASGRQLDMVCLCGKRLPRNNPVSICNSCLNDSAREDGYYDDVDESMDDWAAVRWQRLHDDDVDESMDGDMESGLASAGFGNDEDYYNETPMFEDYGGE